MYGRGLDPKSTDSLQQQTANRYEIRDVTTDRSRASKVLPHPRAPRSHLSVREKKTRDPACVRRRRSPRGVAGVPASRGRRRNGEETPVWDAGHPHAAAPLGCRWSR